ncbi:hypothetical protein TVAG_146060 [Trichomonas vaginalis G3]|uniref:Leucine Rich Repeat family protein n=1 Tax=Trichomonas vaginalis (strain ATCC PRA-98 / G3) TaxID=412133 RepID=A2F8A9_TRIV3|nr:leucine-rich repeat, isoform f-related family [Trichomonas vaginalis G3]EAX98869.1 hypothetical protein TVAG_146060 [Trichomonas vaginalis G3]KAI5540553.1 leucine-rich repeat, isoform f-related family [Trichomonas vaginalis G3]|eukprot:XP_001311799.1 hypothetical protein [Trichomonas vaginalis G3]
MIDVSRVLEAAEDSRAKNRIVLYASSVMKYNYDGGEEPRILIISDSSVIYYMYSKSLVETTSCSWCNLTGMRFEGNIISLTFGTEIFSFKAKDPYDISQKILVYLQRTKTYVEIDLIYPFSINDYNYLPNAIGLLTRFKNVCEKVNLPITDDIMSYLRDIIIHNRPIIDTSNSSVTEPYFVPIMATIQLAKCIRTIVITNSRNGSLFSIFANFLQSTISTFSHIHIFGDCLQGFENLCASLKNTDNCAVSSISFSECNPSDSNIKSLLELCKARIISSLAFRNISKFNFMRLFYDSNYRAVVNTITMLNFDDTVNLDIALILQNFKNLTSLSLARCNIDIPVVLDMISNSDNQKIGMVCLVGNYCKNEFRKIPPLYLLDISSVTFAKGTLLSYFYYLFSKNIPHELNLRISNAILSDLTEWDNIFELMDSQDTHCFSGLSWCGNPIHKSLINLLPKNTALEELILDKCDLSHVINDLCNVIPKLRKLLTFSYSGRALPDALKIVQALSSVNINELKLEDTKSGDDLLDELSTLAKSSKELYLISFDGSEFNSYECFDKLIDIIEQRSIKFTLCWPTKDIERLKLEEQEVSMFRARIWSFFNQLEENKVDYLDLFDPALKPFQYSHYSVYFPMNNVLEELECPQFDQYPQYYNQYVSYVEKKISDYNKLKIEHVQKTNPVPISSEDVLTRDFCQAFNSSSSDFDDIDFTNEYDIKEFNDEEIGLLLSQEKEKTINIDLEKFKTNKVSTFTVTEIPYFINQAENIENEEKSVSNSSENLVANNYDPENNYIAKLQTALDTSQAKIEHHKLISNSEEYSEDVPTLNLESERNPVESLDLSYETVDSIADKLNSQENKGELLLISKDDKMLDSLEQPIPVLNTPVFSNLKPNNSIQKKSVKNSPALDEQALFQSLDSLDNLSHLQQNNSKINQSKTSNILLSDEKIDLGSQKKDKIIFSSAEILLPYELNSIEFLEPSETLKSHSSSASLQSSDDKMPKARRVSNAVASEEQNSKIETKKSQEESSKLEPKKQNAHRRRSHDSNEGSKSDMRKSPNDNDKNKKSPSENKENRRKSTEDDKIQKRKSPNEHDSKSAKRKFPDEDSDKNTTDVNVVLDGKMMSYDDFSSDRKRDSSRQKKRRSKHRSYDEDEKNLQRNNNIKRRKSIDKEKKNSLASQIPLQKRRSSAEEKQEVKMTRSKSREELRRKSYEEEGRDDKRWMNINHHEEEHKFIKSNSQSDIVLNIEDNVKQSILAEEELSPRKRSSSLLETQKPNVKELNKSPQRRDRRSMTITADKSPLAAEYEEIPYRKPKFRFTIEWFSVKSSREIFNKKDHKYRLSKLINYLENESDDDE